MTYREALRLLDEYYETFHPEGKYAEAMLKGRDAINRILKKRERRNK